MINAEQYFLKIADTVAEQSTCLDKAVGCVLVSQDNQIIACGYNGAPSKYPDCKLRGYCNKTIFHKGYCIATHAEINALIKAGERAKGGKLFVSLEPCIECAKAIINAQIKEVYYNRENGKSSNYKTEVMHLFDYVGIKYEHLSIEERK